MFTKLLGLQYKGIYKKGIENSAADALSRCSPDDQLLALSTVKPQWLSNIQSTYDQDPLAQELLAKLAISPNVVPHFSLDQGILKYDGRIWLGSDESAHQRIFQALHSNALGGHSGAPATYHRIKNLFYWANMKADIWAMVQKCEICQKAKPDRSKYPGLLQPLLVPSAAWDIISMDFVEGLPMSGSSNAILVVIDKYTKYGHFIPLHHPFTAHSVAKLFMDTFISCMACLQQSYQIVTRYSQALFGSSCSSWQVLNCV